MGLDFIRQRAKAFTRSWDHHRISLSERTLLSVDPDRSARTALARTTGTLERGSTILICIEGSGLIGYQELTRVASFVDPPPDLVRLVELGGGVAEGQVVSVLDESVVEVTVC